MGNTDSSLDRIPLEVSPFVRRVINEHQNGTLPEEETPKEKKERLLNLLLKDADSHDVTLDGRGHFWTVHGTPLLNLHCNGVPAVLSDPNRTKKAGNGNRLIVDVKDMNPFAIEYVVRYWYTDTMTLDIAIDEPMAIVHGIPIFHSTDNRLPDGKFTPYTLLRDMSLVARLFGDDRLQRKILCKFHELSDPAVCRLDILEEAVRELFSAQGELFSEQYEERVERDKEFLQVLALDAWGVLKGMKEKNDEGENAFLGFVWRYVQVNHLFARYFGGISILMSQQKREGTGEVKKEEEEKGEEEE